MSDSVRELCLKLAATLHLSMPERRSLPEGQAPFTEIVAAVKDRLHAIGWFPAPLSLDGVIGEGALLELRGDDIWVHEQHEIGVGRYSPVERTRAVTLEDAVRAYLEANGGSPVDGVSIDWSS
jgi:hypothetical protein